MGRKKLSDDVRREKPLRIRLSPEERAAVDKAAGGKTSTWAREALLRAAKRRVK
jgi:uncharacterized protein (DUF1778 family)